MPSGLKSDLGGIETKHIRNLKQKQETLKSDLGGIETGEHATKTVFHGPS